MGGWVVQAVTEEEGSALKWRTWHGLDVVVTFGEEALAWVEDMLRVVVVVVVVVVEKVACLG